jgi:hypothetical protein
VQHKSNLLVYKSLNLLKHEIDLKIHFDNDTGLSEVYNQYITPKNAKKYDIALFLHDDVYVDDLKIRGKLYQAIQQYDIVGLAGCLSPRIKSPSLWHLMSGYDNHRGYVAHANPDDITTVRMTSFGPSPSRVILIDGLFMAVSLKAAIRSEWRFNESFKFHHYDLSSCLDANSKGLKIGVSPINVIHASPGLRSLHDSNFKHSEKKFLEKYT